MINQTFDPYCGPAPLPQTLWAQWNFDPVLIAGLGALVLCYLRFGARGPRGDGAFLGAFALMLVAFVSPLCALSSALFSARVFHHIVLVAAIAPLLAVAFPLRGRALMPLSAAFIAHTAILWFWHAPMPYGWAMTGAMPYWIMQATLLGSALWLWRLVLAPATPVGRALGALLGSVIQMGLLGALLVFAPVALFAPHFATTAPFGLTPLEDQQLSGLLMWVPSILPYLGVGLWQVLRLIGTPPAAGTAR